MLGDGKCVRNRHFALRRKEAGTVFLEGNDRHYQHVNCP